MSIQGPLHVECDEQFPHGLFAVAVDAQRDFEKSQAGAEDVQARDKESGERVWVIRVLDNDPDARASEFKVKVVAPYCPDLPAPLPGTNFRPVTFKHMTITPYVEETRGGRGRVAFSVRAARVEAPTVGRKPTTSTAGPTAEPAGGSAGGSSQSKVA